MAIACQYHRSLAVFMTVAALIVFVWKFPELPQLGGNHLDKLSHLILFFTLGCCYINTATRGFEVVTLSRLLTGFVTALTFGVVIEALQHFIPWRSVELLDLVAGGIGVSMALAFCLYVQKSMLRSRY